MNRLDLLRAPRILVFDSGLGGLTVHVRIAEARPDATFTYVADDAAFPYGALSEREVVARVMSVMEQSIARHAPDLVVIACSTASTLVLAPLRERYADLPFVGTVPAIKPAAAASKSRLVSVLATPGTVARDYTRDLVKEHAGDCEIVLVGSARLASLAEQFLRGVSVDDRAIADEIAPAFARRGKRRTDVVVLACTHYPLLLDQIRRVAPWAVEYIDPAPAIARRVDALLGPPMGSLGPTAPAPAIFTSGLAPGAALRDALARFGLSAAPTRVDALDFSRC